MILVTRKCVTITATTKVSAYHRTEAKKATDDDGFLGIAIIATIILVGIAGIGIQVAIALYMLRRMGAMQDEISESRKEISKVAERVARLEGILIGRLEVGNGTIT